ncbi:hypothetical protein HK102_001256 [Quaeritorhiza haematococci]|nr:hypothetical protein HK102_001256 [Quaeritorhiza haematococci]
MASTAQTTTANGMNGPWESSTNTAVAVGEAPTFHVLLTGFEPFLSYPTNPSQLVANHLNKTEYWCAFNLPYHIGGPSHFRLVFHSAVLPVDSNGANAVAASLRSVWEKQQQLEPARSDNGVDGSLGTSASVTKSPWHAIIHMGLDGRAARAYIETCAWNRNAHDPKPQQPQTQASDDATIDTTAATVGMQSPVLSAVQDAHTPPLTRPSTPRTTTTNAAIPTLSKRGDHASPDPVDDHAPILLPTTANLGCSTLNGFLNECGASSFQVIEALSAALLASASLKNESSDSAANTVDEGGSGREWADGRGAAVEDTVPVPGTDSSPSSLTLAWSRDAGTYFCNETYFRTLWAVRKLGITVPRPYYSTDVAASTEPTTKSEDGEVIAPNPIFGGGSTVTGATGAALGGSGTVNNVGANTRADLVRDNALVPVVFLHLPPFTPPGGKGGITLESEARIVCRIAEGLVRGIMNR